MRHIGCSLPIRFVLGGLLSFFTGSASAQWKVVNLHPDGAYYSFGLGVEGGQLVGLTDFGFGGSRAILWSGSGYSWVMLDAGKATDGWAFGVGSGQQAGFATLGGDDHACVWSGTSESWVDLNPAGAQFSYAWGTHGGQQGGYANIDGTPYASLWTGTAASWVNLGPGVVEGVHGGQQVGRIFPAWHASLWTGTAGSVVDLNPEWSLGSIAHGTDGVQQVGIFGPLDGGQHACLWRGTANSLVDLHPMGVESYNSKARAVHGGQQVGYVQLIGGQYRASMWSGSSNSWIDLQALLPSEFTSSDASGIWHSGLYTYVVGSGYNSSTARYEALLWIAPTKYLRPRTAPPRR